jgi:molybdopterin/thiamine biosynthesis adenylyltransferase
VDPDRYERHNLLSQDIEPAAIGRKKVAAQAQRLARICPGAVIDPIPSDVRRVPLGRLRADVIFGCVDSRASRQAVNTVAWRLGVPWIDAGVDAGGLLARVQVFRPMDASVCVECYWDDTDYARIEQTYPCQAVSGSRFSTGTPSPLGSLAASLQALEGRKVLAGQWDQALVNRKLVIDASYHKHYVPGFRPVDTCRFDHVRWRPQLLECSEAELTLGQALELGRVGGAGPVFLEVEHARFVRRLTCIECHDSVEVLRRVNRVAGQLGRCPSCDGPQFAPAFDLLHSLSSADLNGGELSLSLRRIGLGPGDVYSVRGPEGSVQFEIPSSRFRSVESNSRGVSARNAAPGLTGLSN